MYNKNQKVKGNSPKELKMKTIGKLEAYTGYRDELIEVKDGTYYRIIRLHKDDCYMLFKKTDKFCERESYEELPFYGRTLKDAKDKIKHLENKTREKQITAKKQYPPHFPPIKGKEKGGGKLKAC